MYFPVDGNYKGRIFTRSVKNLKQGRLETSPWSLLGKDSSYTADDPIEGPGEMNKGGIDSE